MAWLSSLSDIALAYDVPEGEIEQRMYALAEVVHQHYCLQRGIINHNEARPDQHVALSMLGALAASDWFMDRRAERVWPALTFETVAASEVFLNAEEPFVHFGDDTVNDSWAEPPDDAKES